MKRNRVKISFMVGLLMLVSQSAFSSSILFFDDFDSYKPGNQLPAPWVTFTPFGQAVVDDTVFSGSSGNSVLLERFEDQRPVYFGLFHDSQNKYVTYEADIRGSTSEREVLTMYGWNDDAVRGPWVSFGFNDGYLSAFDGTDHINIAPVDADTWYHTRMVADITTNTFDIYINDMGEPVLTGLPFNSSRGPATFLNSLWFQVYNDPFLGDKAWIDNVMIRTDILPSGVIPEPSSLLLLGTGLLGLAGAGFRKKHKRR